MRGAGARSTRVLAGPALGSRVIDVPAIVTTTDPPEVLPSDAEVEISDLTVSDGRDTTGAGVRNVGTLHLRDVTVRENQASGDGGGVRNDLNLTIERTTVRGNSADIFGGGVFNNGTAEVENSTVSGNSADVSGGGLGNLRRQPRHAPRDGRPQPRPDGRQPRQRRSRPAAPGDRRPGDRPPHGRGHARREPAGGRQLRRADHLRGQEPRVPGRQLRPRAARRPAARPARRQRGADRHARAPNRQPSHQRGPRGRLPAAGDRPARRRPPLGPALRHRRLRARRGPPAREECEPVAAAGGRRAHLHPHGHQPRTRPGRGRRDHQHAPVRGDLPARVEWVHGVVSNGHVRDRRPDGGCVGDAPNRRARRSPRADREPRGGARPRRIPARTPRARAPPVPAR